MNPCIWAFIAIAVACGTGLGYFAARGFDGTCVFLGLTVFACFIGIALANE